MTDNEKNIPISNLPSDEAQETLRAIRDGEIDALVVAAPDGEKVYTLTGAERPYRVFVENMTEGAVTLSPDGAILYANRRFAEMVHLPVEYVIGSSILPLFGSADRHAFQALLRAAAQSAQTAECVFQLADDATVPVHVSASPLQAETLDAVAVVVTDLTEQKRRDEVLAAERLARSILEQATEPIVVCDDRGRIIRASRAARELCGRDPLFQPFNDLFPLHLEDGRPLRFCLDNGKPNPTDPAPLCLCQGVKATEALFENNGRRNLLVNAGPLRDGHDRIVGCVVTLTDITDRKLDELALQRSRDQLDQLVHQRTEQLARSNADLEHFAYIASHDLREPLRTVASFVELLQRRYNDRLDDDARSYIKYAADGAKRMNSLIQDLLAYSRISTRGQPPKPTDLNDAFERAVRNVHAAIDETDAQITHDPLPTVPADPTQILQIFQNLLENAIKFRSGKPPRIHVWAERRDPDSVTIAVRDNGIGIAPEFADRIFVPFQRLHTHQKYPGSGIGLAICQRIVQRHNGKIWVESQPEQGATFFFTLPTHA